MRRGFMIGVVAMAAAASATVARADTWAVSLYGGWNGSFNSDVHFTGSDTNWTVKDVPWDGVSWSPSGGAPYYGYRLMWSPSAMPGWSFGIDYTHAKIRAVRDATVDTSGTLDGNPLDGPHKIDDLFDVMEYTDGLNLIFLTGIHDLHPIGMIQPYVGAGAGISVPHVEVTGHSPDTHFPTTFAYEFGGVAAEALIGARMPVYKRLSIFAEYKLSYARVDSPLEGGYKIHSNTITNHVLAGLTLTFGH